WTYRSRKAPDNAQEAAALGLRRLFQGCGIERMPQGLADRALELSVERRVGDGGCQRPERARLAQLGQPRCVRVTRHARRVVSRIVGAQGSFLVDCLAHTLLL